MIRRIVVESDDEDPLPVPITQATVITKNLNSSSKASSKNSSTIPSSRNNMNAVVFQSLDSSSEKDSVSSEERTSFQMNLRSKTKAPITRSSHQSHTTTQKKKLKRAIFDSDEDFIDDGTDDNESVEYIKTVKNRSTSKNEMSDFIVYSDDEEEDEEELNDARYSKRRARKSSVSSDDEEESKEGPRERKRKASARTSPINKKRSRDILHDEDSYGYEHTKASRSSMDKRQRSSFVRDCNVPEGDDEGDEGSLDDFIVNSDEGEDEDEASGNDSNLDSSEGEAEFEEVPLPKASRTSATASSAKGATQPPAPAAQSMSRLRVIRADDEDDEAPTILAISNQALSAQTPASEGLKSVRRRITIDDNSSGDDVPITAARPARRSSSAKKGSALKRRSVFDSDSEEVEEVQDKRGADNEAQDDASVDEEESEEEEDQESEEDGYALYWRVDNQHREATSVIDTSEKSLSMDEHFERYVEMMARVHTDKDALRVWQKHSTSKEAVKFATSARKVQDLFCTYRESILGSNAWSGTFMQELLSRPFYAQHYVS
jgi:hypothetical protein